jgi:AcrR family transcriptional regulator
MTDPRVAKTRAALGAAVLALTAEKPFADITITEIAERAGVGYASFFRHYRDKDALLADVADSLVDDLTAIIMPAVNKDDTGAASVAICQFVEEHRLIARALLSGGAESEIRRHIVERAVDQGRAAPEPSLVPQSLIICHCVASTLGLLTWWLEQGEAVSAEAMGGVIDRLVMAPVRTMQVG